jgi:hypothetical protein
MRLLLDECVPRPLRQAYIGQFNALFTVDRDFGGPPATTGTALRLIILAVGTTDPIKLRPHLPAVLIAIEQARPGQVVVVGA